MPDAQGRSDRPPTAAGALPVVVVHAGFEPMRLPTRPKSARRCGKHIRIGIDEPEALVAEIRDHQGQHTDAYRLGGGHIEMADVQRYEKRLRDRLRELNERPDEIIDPRPTACLVRKHRCNRKSFYGLFGASVLLLSLDQ